jgi:hypothetical protein
MAKKKKAPKEEIYDDLYFMVGGWQRDYRFGTVIRKIIDTLDVDSIRLIRSTELAITPTTCNRANEKSCGVRIDARRITELRGGDFARPSGTTG